MAGWLLPVAISVGSSLLNSMLNKNQKSTSPTTVKQEPLQTPEQEEAMKALLGFGKTGQLGSYKSGEQYGGALGNYDLSGLEQTGMSSLMGMMGNLPESFGLGTEEMKKLFTTDAYDPMKTGMYDSAKKQIMRESSEGMDALKRNLAVTGDLRSSFAGKEMGLLGERTQDSLQSKLLELADTYAQRKLGMIPTALQAGQAERGMDLDLSDRAMTYGAVERQLKDMQAKDKYNEWLRARGDELTRLDAYKTASSGVNWGAKELTLPGEKQESPWTGLLNLISGLGGQMGMLNYMKG